MTTRMPWFRMYSEVLNDRKLRKVCQLCKQPKAVVLGVWVTLLAIASESPDRGRLLIGSDLPLDLDDLADETGLPIPELDAIMVSFKQMGMVLETGYVANWNSRQFQSDLSTPRVRKHRAKTRKQDETLPKRYSNVIDTDTESDTETEEEHMGVDVLQIVCEASGLSSIPPREMERIEQITRLVEDHGHEQVTAMLKRAFTTWRSTDRKDGRGKYSATNMGWVDWGQELLIGGALQQTPTDQLEGEAWVMARLEEMKRGK